MADELLWEKATGDWFSRSGCDDRLCGDVIAMTLCAPEVDEEESWEEARLSLRCDIVDWLLEGDTTPEVVGMRCVRHFRCTCARLFIIETVVL